jgi:hypothetical protein
MLLGHILTPCLCRINFNISHPRVVTLSRFPTKIVYVSRIPPIHAKFFAHFTFHVLIFGGAQIMKPLISPYVILHPSTASSLLGPNIPRMCQSARDVCTYEDWPFSFDNLSHFWRQILLGCPLVVQTICR